MKKLRKFAQLLKVIWVEDIQHWMWFHTIGKWRIDKCIREGICLVCGNKWESEKCECHTRI